MILDWIPDPAHLWRTNPYHNKANMVFPTTPSDHVLNQKVQLAKERPSLTQYPLLTHQGNVPVHLVGVPTPAAAYEPVPVRKPDNSPSTNAIVHFAEGAVYTAQGEVRDHVLHPFHHLGYTLTHHPIDFAKQLWDYTRRGMGWVVFQYTDFIDHLRHWDGSWISFTQTIGLLWRGAIALALTVGIVELSPLLQALGTWLRLVYDFIRGALGLVGEALDVLWYLLERLWYDITSYLGR